LSITCIDLQIKLQKDMSAGEYHRILISREDASAAPWLWLWETGGVGCQYKIRGDCSFLRVQKGFIKRRDEPQCLRLRKKFYPDS